MPAGGTTISYDFGRVPTLAGGVFSPGVPLLPSSPQLPRSFDFPVGINTNMRPRAFASFGFPALRAFANVEMVRMAIETRKDQIERLGYQIKPIENAKGESGQAKIDELTAFFAKPDGVTPFASFVRLLLEDLLSIDAPAMEIRRTRGGALCGLEVIPGDTIHPMVDDTGRRPRDPAAIAYQQVIKGTPWVNLTNRDLLYLPRNIRPNHLYGFGPVEQITVTINTIIRRQAMQLAHFTDGNVPAGLLTAPDGWDLTKIADLQTWFDQKIVGNLGERQKLIWGPSGSKYEPFVAPPIKDEFDEWLARLVAFAFSLPPTPFIRQMNKGTAGEDQERALEEGLEPLKLWVKRWIDGLIQGEMGCPGLEFVWLDNQTIDPKVQTDIDDKNVRNGSTSIDEIRAGRGEDPLPNGQGAEPMIYTTTGAMTLDQLKQTNEAAIKTANTPPPAPIVAAAPGKPANAPGKGAPAATKPLAPGKAPKAQKLGKALISPQRPKARRAIASITKALIPILAKAGDHAAADVVKALKVLGKADGGDDPEAIANAIANKLTLESLDGVAAALETDTAEIAADSGAQALASVGVGVEDDELTGRVFDRAVAYAEKRAADLVSLKGEKNIVDTTREAIRATIEKGLADNIGADAIGDALQSSFAFSAARAELIAKTEVAFANGAGKAIGWHEAADSGVIITKGWTVSANDNTCEECLGNEADGEIPLDDSFSSGDDMEPAHPGCQCATYAVAADPADADATESEGEAE